MSRRAHCTKSRAFTVVEVVIALGVIAFAVVAVLGILGAAIDATRDSRHDTKLAAMSAEVLGHLRTVPFDALWEAVPAADAAPATPPTDPPQDSHYYFTDEGAPVNVADPSGHPEILYQCTVLKTPDPLTRGQGDGPFNLLKLDLVFAWPAPMDPAAKSVNKFTLHASIARY